ncbi:MAG: type III pantothenate kinase [Flavobacteriaceae bacterium]|nr:type III pantothenate kinase [Flavobacteriaceae bacterium]
MQLIIDIGNTHAKIAVFENTTIITQRRFLWKEHQDIIQNIFLDFPKISSGIVSNVGKLEEKQRNWLLSILPDLHFLSHQSKIPFQNEYRSPSTLGIDRIALMSAAITQYPNQNVLVIDAGSCITYDLLTAQGIYLGGAIAPGIGMRYKAMHDYTAKLPSLEKQYPDHFIGDTTENSMHSGASFATICEIEGVLTEYKQYFKDLTVILTGGDAVFLSKRLKSTIFANLNFLLEGLNYLLEYNRE